MLLLAQMALCERTYQQQQQQHRSATEIDCDGAGPHDRCPMATPGGGVEDELLCQRPYRCPICRVGFKLKVAALV